MWVVFFFVWVVAVAVYSGKFLWVWGVSCSFFVVVLWVM